MTNDSTSNVKAGKVQAVLRKLRVDNIDSRFALVMGAVLVAAPVLVGPSYQFLLAEMLILGLFAMGYDFLYGYTGVVSFGHAMFYGVGAYATVLASQMLGLDSIWVLLGVAILAAGIYGLSIALLTSRTTGVYFSIITLAWAQITYILFSNFTNITGGSNGLSFSAPDIVIVPGALSFSIFDPTAFYYLVFGMLVVTFIVLRRLVNSPFGAVLHGIRTNSGRMKYLGYNERRYRIVVFSLSAGVSGLAGGLNAFLTNFVSPSSMHFILSGEVLVWTVLGGKGTLLGPVFGAALVRFLESVLSQQFTWWFIPIGILFVVVVIFMPDGVAGGVAKLKQRVRDRIQD